MRRSSLGIDTPKPPGCPALKISLLIFALACLVRLAYLYESSASPTFRTPIIDSRTYDQFARSYLETGRFGETFFWQPFFYPFFLAMVYTLNGGSMLGAKLVQVVVGGLTCVLTYRLGRASFGPRAGVIAAMMAVFCGPLVFLEGELLGEGWAAFWTAALLLLFLYRGSRYRRLGDLLLGVFGALATLSRPTFLPFVLAGWAWLIVAGWRRGSGPAALAKRLALGAAGFLIIALPVAIQSARATGVFSFLPTSGGLNLYIGNNPAMYDTLIARPGGEYDRLLALPQQQGITDWAGKQRYFNDLVRQYVVGHPRSFCMGLAAKTAHFFSSREVPRNVSLYNFRDYSWILSALVWKVGRFGFPFGVLWPLVLLGLIVKRREVPVPLILFMILYPISVILVFSSGRYRVPMVPAVCVLAAAACCWAAEQFRPGGWRRLGAAAAGGIALAWCISRLGPFPMERLDYRAEMYLFLADDARQTGRAPELAIDYYRRALQLTPTYADARVNLGGLLLQQGRLDEGIATLTEALEVRPDDFGGHNNLGVALLQRQRFEEAAAHFREAARIKPGLADVQANLGLATMLAGRDEEAIAAFGRALQLQPHDAETLGHLGGLYLRSGKLDAAVDCYTRAVAEAPDSLEAATNLADVLNRLGRTDEANAAYRRTLQAHRSAVAHLRFGMALELQGKPAEAVEQYQQALQLDPGNAEAATRLRAAQRSRPQ